MEIENNKYFAKKSFVRSVLLLIICTPLLIGTILKLFYFLPEDGNQFTDAIAEALRNLVSKIYHSFEPIQYLWPISPTPSVETLFTAGNFFSLIVLIGFLWGIASFQMGVATVDELAEAKKNARKKVLEDEYRDQR